MAEFVEAQEMVRRENVINEQGTIKTVIEKWRMNTEMTDVEFCTFLMKTVADSMLLQKNQKEFAFVNSDKSFSDFRIKDEEAYREAFADSSIRYADRSLDIPTDKRCLFFQQMATDRPFDVLERYYIWLVGDGEHKNFDEFRGTYFTRFKAENDKIIRDYFDVEGNLWRQMDLLIVFYSFFPYDILSAFYKWYTSCNDFQDFKNSDVLLFEVKLRKRMAIYFDTNTDPELRKKISRCIGTGFVYDMLERFDLWLRNKESNE